MFCPSAVEVGSFIKTAMTCSQTGGMTLGAEGVIKVGMVSEASGAAGEPEGVSGDITEFRPSLNSCASHSCDVRQFRSLYTKNRWVISVMGSPIDVGGWYPFITFFTLPRLSGKFLLDTRPLGAVDMVW